MPISTSLRMLREQQDAWRRCEWREKEDLHLDALRGDQHCATKYRNGVLAIGHSPSTGPVITCLKVASATTGKDAKEKPSQWVLGDLGIKFKDFAIDPLIDLVVLVEPNPNM